MLKLSIHLVNQIREHWKKYLASSSCLYSVANFQACQLSVGVGLLSLLTFRRITISDGIGYNVPNSSVPSVPSGKLSLNMLQMVNVTIGFYTSHKNKWNS